MKMLLEKRYKVTKCITSGKYNVHDIANNIWIDTDLSYDMAKKKANYMNWECHIELFKECQKLNIPFN